MKILQRSNGSWQLWYYDKDGKRKAVTLKVDGRNPRNEKEAEKARDAIVPSLFVEKPQKYSTAKRKAKQTKRKKGEVISRKPYTREEIDDIIEKLDRGITIPYHYKSHGVEHVVERPINIRYRDEIKTAILLGAYSGLRLTDVVHLHSDQIHDGFIVLKPRKTRLTSGVEITTPILHSWLVEHLRGVTGYFMPHLKALHDKSDSMCARIFTKLFRWCGYETQVECKDRPNASVLGFHALRHSFATWAANENVPIEIVQSVLGHTSVTTTRIYAHVSAQRKARELARIMLKTD